MRLSKQEERSKNGREILYEVRKSTIAIIRKKIKLLYIGGLNVDYEQGYDAAIKDCLDVLDRYIELKGEQ